MPAPQENQLLQSSQREAIVTLAVWLVTMLVSLTVCYILGYQRKIEDLTYIWGIPDWVFWGVLAPWVVCIGVCGWFAFSFVQDEPLGDEQEEREVSSETDA